MEHPRGAKRIKKIGRAPKDGGEDETKEKRAQAPVSRFILFSDFAHTQRS